MRDSFLPLDSPLGDDDSDPNFVQYVAPKPEFDPEAETEEQEQISRDKYIETHFEEYTWYSTYNYPHGE
jgi:hypothetical protein